MKVFLCRLVLAVRGTQQMGDAIINACGAPEPFDPLAAAGINTRSTGNGSGGFVHRGVLHAAQAGHFFITFYSNS
jgi:hypothetical protein